MNFENGIAEVECEVEVTFDFDDLENSCRLSSFKFNNKYEINIDCDRDNIHLTEIDSEDQYF